MMSKEEVAAIVLYCKEHNISFKSRLDELGISAWQFYRSKRAYAGEESQELLAIGPSGKFISCPDLNRKARRSQSGQTSTEPKGISIEFQTENGVMMRIQGDIDNAQLQTIILSVRGHV